MTRKNKRRKEEICEDYCFSCKDGGLLIICDYKDCLKAYHPDCVEKDETFMDSGERWNCLWHNCFICHKLSKFHCLCCPRAVCGQCLHDAEFVIFKGDKGMCQICLNLALLFEDGGHVDSEGVTVDFKDEKSHEFFFIGYWEHIKKKEDLTRESLRVADELLKKNKNYWNDLHFLETGKITENIGQSEDESHSIVSDYDDLEEASEYKSGRKGSRSKKKSKTMNGKREKSKKMEFVEWGSKSLFEFLHFVKQDTSKPMTEHEVVNVVMKYCTENKRFDPQKRKRIICDDTLRALFRKNLVLKNSLSKLLSAHFASNVEDSTGDDEDDDDGLGSGSDNDGGVDLERKKSSVSVPRTQKAKVNPEVQRSCYASVTSENIKLVYLKRSLVNELLSQGQDFEKKIVGSFVRVKSNPNDYLQKNSHQLLQVIAITTSIKGDILLQLVNRVEDFSVNELSDDNFTEEECEDLLRKVNEGLLKKLTIVELEQKAQSLHKDMINHWIPRELAFLRRRIDHAHEKGWRREMSEYLDRVQLLNDQSERQRLLDDFPEIIAEPIVQELQRDDDSSSDSPHFPLSDLGSDSFSYQNDIDDQTNQSVASTCEKPPQETHVTATEVGDNILEAKHHHQPISEINAICCEKLSPKELEPMRQASTALRKSDNINIQSQVQSSSSSAVVEGNANRQTAMESQSTLKVEVIELSDDDDEEELPECNKVERKDLHSEEARGEASGFKEREASNDNGGESMEDVLASMWCCRSGQGHRAGPFRLSSLKRCHETRDYEVEIMVWKLGGREEDAVLLDDLIHKLFPPDSAAL